MYATFSGRLRIFETELDLGSIYKYNIIINQIHFIVCESSVLNYVKVSI